MIFYLPWSYLASWKVEYSARDIYGGAIGGWPATESLNPAFWHTVTEAFATNDTVFQLYNSFKNRGFDVAVCDGDCRTETICNLRAMRAENNCVCFILNRIPYPILIHIQDIVTPGLNFRKRSSPPNEAGAYMDHCEGTGLGHVISLITNKIVSQCRTVVFPLLNDCGCRLGRTEIY